MIKVAAPKSATVLSPADQQLVLLETLKSLLDVAVRSLSGGEALPLLEASRQITATADRLTAFSLQMTSPSWSPETQQQRRKLLGELSQQQAFCRSMLRRWRRSIALRRHLLDLQSGPLAYNEDLKADWR